MATVVRLQVSELDFTDEDRIDSIEQRVPEVSFVLSDGVVVAEIYLDAAPASQYEQVTEIILRLRSHDGLVIERVEPFLVNVSDIARLVGLSRQAVTKWTRNPHFAFPKAEGSVGSEGRPQKIWSLYSVNKWLSDNMKLDLGLELPSPQLVRKIDAFLVEPQESSLGGWAVLPVEGLTSTSMVEGLPTRASVSVTSDFRFVVARNSQTWFDSVNIKMKNEVEL